MIYKYDIYMIFLLQYIFLESSIDEKELVPTGVHTMVGYPVTALLYSIT